MVGALVLVAGAAALAASGALKGGKSKKFFDLTKGILGDVAMGMGGGAILNKLDNVIAGGMLQNTNTARFGLGTPNKGQNLNGTDALLALGTTGLGFSKKTLMRFAPILIGKKIGEFTGAIDPAEPMNSSNYSGAGFTNNPGVRT